MRDNNRRKYKKLEEGGVLGIFAFAHENGQRLDVPALAFYGLYTLQHRGQTSCGLTCSDKLTLSAAKGKGLVSEVIEPRLHTLKGSMAVGHVKYALSDEGEQTIPPLTSIYLKGTLTISLGGTITNSEQIKAELEDEGAIFQSGSDAEVLAHLLARLRARSGSIEEAVIKAMRQVEGAFSAVVMSPAKLLAFRDGDGYRPLSMGGIYKTDKDGKEYCAGYVFASEDVAFSAMGARPIRDIKPGELAACSAGGINFYRSQEGESDAKTCIYEYMYFARPDSIIDGKSVYEARVNAGRELFKACPAEADVVIGVPSAGLHFALGYSRESGIPFGDGLIRNYYLGRTTDHDSAIRDVSLSVKLNVCKAAIKDMRVVLVNDTMILGKTAKKIIANLKECGAREVHLRIACPRFASPCPYSPSLSSTLYDKSLEEIKSYVNADSVGFLPLEGMNKIGLSQHCCKKCFER